MISDEAVDAAKDAIWNKFLDRALDCWPDFKPEALAALEAAAPYLVERRTITTVEELDALPDGAVLRDASGAIREMFTDVETEDSLWCRPGSGGYLLSAQFHGGLLPATVLYEPEQTS